MGLESNVAQIAARSLVGVIEPMAERVSVEAGGSRGRAYSVVGVTGRWGLRNKSEGDKGSKKVIVLEE